MKPIKQALFLGIILGGILSSCVKQPETIVVNENPKSLDTLATPRDTTGPVATSPGFKQLNIGELHPISTLDPLFADNNSARRTVQNVFEGLVRYNREGEIVPAIADSWTVSDDSLSYTFSLKTDIFFHDSNIFGSGVGRKVLASDIRFAFERMAKNSVPDDAAKLFMSIQGFEPFFNEQHNVLNPVRRELDGVRGINTPDDSTVRFSLIEKDPHFLQKLASPYSVIYPREAVKSSPQNFAPVGTGPFEISQTRGDSVYTFSKFEDYSENGDTPIINRIDVIVETNESRLLKSLARGDIHLIPEIGPQIIESSLTPDATLQPGYAQSFTLMIPGGKTVYTINHNPDANTSREAVQPLFAKLDITQLNQRIPAQIITVDAQPDSSASTTTVPPSQVFGTYTEDPFQRWILQRISNQWGPEQQLQLLQIRTPTRQTALYTNSFVSFYSSQKNKPDANTLLSYSVSQVALSINRLERFRLNRYPWWIDLRNVNLPGIDQL